MPYDICDSDDLELLPRVYLSRQKRLSLRVRKLGIKGDITGGNVPASAFLTHMPYCRPDDLTNNWSSGDEAEPLLANVTGLENYISGF
jgi:hypothetical protein